MFLEDKMDLTPAALSPELAAEWLAKCQPNPAAGYDVKLLPPFGYTGPVPLRMGRWVCPCPCCGALMVTLEGMPGFFPAGAVEIVGKEDTDDA